MPLLEIITTEQTADWVTATCVEFGKRQGKTVIVVNDGTDTEPDSVSVIGLVNHDEPEPDIYTPKLGAAVHINAFNFPVWGMLEKLAYNVKLVGDGEQAIQALESFRLRGDPHHELGQANLRHGRS